MKLPKFINLAQAMEIFHGTHKQPQRPKEEPMQAIGNPGARLAGLATYCETAGGATFIFIEEVRIESDSNECETCGSHGSTHIEYDCCCGQVHRYKLSEW